MILPKSDRLSWQDYYMLMAILTAQRSPDPNTQVGSIIYDSKNRLVGTGYNSTPRGINPKNISWEREGDFENTKYARIVHSEVNAIFNAPSKDLEGCTLVITLFPCNDCAKVIIQAGIKNVVYLDNKYKDTPQSRVSEELFENAFVNIKLHRWSNKEHSRLALQKLLELVGE